MAAVLGDLRRSTGHGRRRAALERFGELRETERCQPLDAATAALWLSGELGGEPPADTLRT